MESFLDIGPRPQRSTRCRSGSLRFSIFPTVSLPPCRHRRRSTSIRRYFSPNRRFLTLDFVLRVVAATMSTNCSCGNTVFSSLGLHEPLYRQPRSRPHRIHLKTHGVHRAVTATTVSSPLTLRGSLQFRAAFLSSPCFPFRAVRSFGHGPAIFRRPSSSSICPGC